MKDSWKELAAGVPLSEIQELPPRSSDVSESNGAKTPPDGSLQEAPHPKDESDIEALRACWAPKVKESMAARLPGNYSNIDVFVFLNTTITTVHLQSYI